MPMFNKMQEEPERRLRSTAPQGKEIELCERPLKPMTSRKNLEADNE